MQGIEAREKEKQEALHPIQNRDQAERRAGYAEQAMVQTTDPKLSATNFTIDGHPHELLP
jgi:hypothetical protein